MKGLCKSGRPSFRKRWTQANGPVERQLRLPTGLESSRRWSESRRDAVSGQPLCLRSVFPDAPGGGQAEGEGPRTQGSVLKRTPSRLGRVHSRAMNCRRKETKEEGKNHETHMVGGGQARSWL